MFKRRILAAGVAGALLVAGAVSANAADLPTLPAAPPPPPPAPVAPAFDWSGPYVGAYGGAILYPPGDPIYQIGAQAGFNFQRGAFLVGAEAYGEYRLSTGFGNHWSAGANARAGAVLGERFLLYGEAGVGYVFQGGGFPVWTAGGGVEVGLGRAASIFAEAKAIGTFTGFCCGTQIQGGVNFHIGN